MLTNLQAIDYMCPCFMYIVQVFFFLSDPSLSAQSPQMQQAHLVGSVGELLRDVQSIQHLLATWRTAVQEMPGIQRSAGQQMNRLENLNKALERRAKLLDRHQTLLNSTVSLHVQ